VITRLTAHTPDRAARAAMSSHIGGLWFINGRGDVLIQRLYRDDVE
jgi:hypothetical protein